MIGQREPEGKEMWICSRCQTANKDGHTQCVECSAPRNARRFGAGTPVPMPSVQTAAPERRIQPPVSRETPPPSARRSVQPPAESVGPSSRMPGGFVRLAGLLMCLLLPLLVLLLAVIRFDAIHPVITSIYFKPGAAVPPFISYLAYSVSALAAILLSMAPGLSLWALGRLTGGLRRR